jgi:hypothetical protein
MSSEFQCNVLLSLRSKDKAVWGGRWTIASQLQFTLPAVLKVPPISHHGKVVEIRHSAGN